MIVVSCHQVMQTCTVDMGHTSILSFFIEILIAVYSLMVLE